MTNEEEQLMTLSIKNAVLEAFKEHNAQHDAIKNDIRKLQSRENGGLTIKDIATMLIANPRSLAVVVVALILMFGGGGLVSHISGNGVDNKVNKAVVTAIRSLISDSSPSTGTSKSLNYIPPSME